MDISRALDHTVIMIPGGLNGSSSEAFQKSSENSFQLITLNGNDEQNSYVVYGTNVKVVVSGDGETVKRDRIGSSKVKISPVVNYDWEHKYYVGNLVAVHLNRTHVAYVLKSKSGGIVRVINRRTAERVLLNGFTESRVVDISFAYMSRVILGVTDQLGSLYVYEITEDDAGKLHCTPKLQCLRPAVGLKSDYHRLIWCLYVPDEDDDEAGLEEEEESLMCLLTHDEKAEIWNVAQASQLCGAEPVSHEAVTRGLHLLNYHSKPIVDAAFSPDGGAVATASLDGSVKFFEIKLSSDIHTKFMHNLLPHDGKPLSCLFFMDNHKHPNSGDKFWRYAVTGADNNTEWKIWNCESWTCTQMLTFTLPLISSPIISPLSGTSLNNCLLKHCLDLSSTYLILSDIHQSVIYIVQFQQTSGQAQICCISEFLLTQSYLSLAVLDAGRHKLNKSAEQHWTLNADDGPGQNDEQDEVEVDDDSEGPGITAVVKLFAIQARAMQELQIRYIPPSSTKYQPSSVSSASDSMHVMTTQDLLSDISFTSDMAGEASGYVDSLKSSGHKSENRSSGENVRMSPDVFTSPSSKQAARDTGSAGSSLTLVTGLHELDDDSYTSAALKSSHQPPSSESLAQLRATQLVAEQIERSMNEVASEMTNDPVDRTNGHPRHRASWSNSSSESTSQEVTEILENIEKSSHSMDGSMLEHDDDKPNCEEEDNSDDSNDIESEENDFQDVNLENRNQDDVDAENADDNSTDNDTDISDNNNDEPEENKTDLNRCDAEIEDGIIIEEMSEEELRSLNDVPSEELMSYDNQNSTSDDIVRDDIINKDHTAETGSSLLASAARDLPVILHSPDVTSNREKSAAGDLPNIVQSPDVIREKSAIRDISNIINSPDVNGGRERCTADDTLIVKPLTSMDDGRRQAGDVGQKSFNNPSQISEQQQEKTAEPSAFFSGINKPEATEQQTNQQMLKNIVDLLRGQQREVAVLREEVRRMKEQSTDTESHLIQLVNDLSSAIDRKTAETLEGNKHKQTEMLNSLTHDFESRSAGRQKKIIEAVGSKLEKEVKGQLKTLVKEAVTSTLAPHITQSLEPLKEKFQVELTRKLSSTDTLLKDNLSKLSKSKQFTDSLSQAVTVKFQESLQATCQDSFLPLFDQYCRNLIQNLGTTIGSGASQYQQKWSEADVKRDQQFDKITQQLSGLVQSVQRDHEGQSKAREQLQSTVETLRDSAAAKSSVESHDQRAEVSAELDKAIYEQFDRLSKDLMVKVKAIITDELTARLGEQQITISEQLHQAIEQSRAASPINQSNADLRASHQRQILALIEANQINAAFEKALSVHDTTLADFICSKIDPATVFGVEPCPLSQIVILSLIQHLAISLLQNTDLKYRYLEEAMTALDQNAAVTRENMGKVLLQLRFQLTAYIQAADKTDSMLRPISKLLKITEIILKSAKGPQMR